MRQRLRRNTRITTLVMLLAASASTIVIGGSQAAYADPVPVSPITVSGGTPSVDPVSPCDSSDAVVGCDFVDETTTLPDASATPAVRNGVIPGEDPLNPYTPDPALVQMHATGVAAVAPFVAALLALNADSTASSPSVVIAGNVPASSSVPHIGAYGGQSQYNSTWCSPASGNTNLIPKDIWPAQEDMAKRMHTDQNGSGTYFTNMVPALNHYFNWFIADTDNNASDLMNKVVFDVADGRIGLTLEVQAGVLPWWKKHGWSGLHSITVYGYDSGKGGHLWVWDPGMSGTSEKGLQKVTLGTAWTANQGSSDEIVY